MFLVLFVFCFFCCCFCQIRFFVFVCFDFLFRKYIHTYIKKKQRLCCFPLFSFLFCLQFVFFVLFLSVLFFDHFFFKNKKHKNNKNKKNENQIFSYCFVCVGFVFFIRKTNIILLFFCLFKKSKGSLIVFFCFFLLRKSKVLLYFVFCFCVKKIKDFVFV